MAMLLPALLIATLNRPAYAAEDNVAPDAMRPDLELLEFLGSFATDEGEWIAPDSLLDNEFPAFLDAASGLATDTPNSGRPGNDGAQNDNAQDADND